VGPFVAENHVIVLTPPPEASMADLRTMADLLNSPEMTALYDRVCGTASVSLKTLMSMKLPSLGVSSRPQKAGLGAPGAIESSRFNRPAFQSRIVSPRRLLFPVLMLFGPLRGRLFHHKGRRRVPQRSRRLDPADDLGPKTCPSACTGF
jgi:hypothetical protein